MGTLPNELTSNEQDDLNQSFFETYINEESFKSKKNKEYDSKQSKGEYFLIFLVQ